MRMMLDLSRQSVGDRYLLLDQLGQGGMGTVHRALDRLTGQYVALKQVLLSSSDSEFGHHALSFALAQEFGCISLWCIAMIS